MHLKNGGCCVVQQQDNGEGCIAAAEDFLLPAIVCHVLLSFHGGVRFGAMLYKGQIQYLNY